MSTPVGPAAPGGGGQLRPLLVAAAVAVALAGLGGGTGLAIGGITAVAAQQDGHAGHDVVLHRNADPGHHGDDDAGPPGQPGGPAPNPAPNPAVPGQGR